VRIASMPEQDRPANRLRHVGAENLTTMELLTLALGVTDTTPAEELLALSSGSLRRLAQLSANRLTDVRGVGIAKAQTLRVVFELGRRFHNESAETSPPIRSPRDLVAVMAPRLEDMGVEEFHVIILDSQHHMQRDVTVTRGILNSSLVHPREVFREAIAERAAAIILVHNHPSGDPSPSTDDRMVTDQLVAAGRLLDIPVHDHVIIGRGRYASFAEAGLL
jgi:DNA repair protein RadC